MSQIQPTASKGMGLLWKYMFLLGVLVSGCQPALKVLDDIDRKLFPYSGRTMLSDSSYVKISDTHLDNSALLGKTVIVQGVVHSRGESDTFLVLQGDGARMVVDMTALSVRLIKKSNHERLKVLGKLAITSLGFPYIVAESIALL